MYVTKHIYNLFLLLSDAADAILNLMSKLDSLHKETS